MNQSNYQDGNNIVFKKTKKKRNIENALLLNLEQ